MTKTIVITGASSGFGKGVAQKLSDQGHNLVLAARRDYLLNDLARDLESAIAVPTDVSVSAEVEHLAARAIEAFGQIDVWINDAGVGAIGAFTEIPLEDQIAVVQTNLIGQLSGSYVAMRHFLARGEGTLINVASSSGKVAMPYYATYSASKAGVLAMNAAIRQELELAGQKQIHVCAVNPWATDTPFWEHTSNYTGHEAQMAMMDDPSIVVDAIVGLIDDPKDEVDVGVKMKGVVLGSHLTPGLAEKAGAKLTHRSLIEDSPAAETTSGAVHEPMAAGSGVDGGVRKRMAEEDQGMA